MSKSSRTTASTATVQGRRRKRSTIPGHSWSPSTPKKGFSRRSLGAGCRWVSRLEQMLHNCAHSILHRFQPGSIRSVKEGGGRYQRAGRESTLERRGGGNCRSKHLLTHLTPFLVGRWIFQTSGGQAVDASIWSKYDLQIAKSRLLELSLLWSGLRGLSQSWS